MEDTTSNNVHNVNSSYFLPLATARGGSLLKVVQFK